MANDIFQFKADLNKMAESLDAAVKTVQKLVTLDVLNLCVEGNPVDTGYSRSQWRIGVGEPDTTVDGVRGETSGKPQPDVSKLDKIEKGQSTFVTNSVDYVQYLEEGSSQQAPNGFIRLALAEAEAHVQEHLESVEEPSR